MVKSKRIKKRIGRKIDIPTEKIDYPYQKEYWNDWEDYRDGFRGHGDKSRIHKFRVPYHRGYSVFHVKGSEWFSKINRKLKRLTKIRKARKKALSNNRNVSI